ncbi:hypothetical protein ACP275_14G091600 [Erythranthe tilingii]
MAVLPVPYVMQPHCVGNESFESSKSFSTSHGRYGKRMTSVSRKLDLRRINLHGGQFTKPIGRISYSHHVTKAIATSDVSVVKTLENVLTYRFWMEIGGQLKVMVKKTNNNKKYGVYVEVESLQFDEEQRELIMIWGIFRDDSTSFMPVQESSTDGTTETPFVKDCDRLSAELEFEESLAPFYVSILLKSKLGSNSKTSTIRSHRKTNFIVPVGFRSGRPSPLGISLLSDGFINFAFFSRNANSVVLCLYADTTVEKPALEIDLDPYVNRSGDIWHASIDCSSLPFVSYGYRCRSSSTDGKGHRVLLDPYAKVIEDFGPRKCLGRLCNESAFDWSGESRPNLPMEKLIVYRLNVARFTNDKSSKLPRDIAGSFSGISDKLHYFKNLGVNAVLLEPIFPFDEQKGPYFPWHFFSPGSLYGPSGDPNKVANSLKEMVKKLHANRMEVLLEVVFTHTSEISALREIDNSSYHHVEGGEELKSRNSLNCNYPIVQQMILECLRYWVTEFHIDGFCFINSSSLTRGFHGEFLSRPPLVEAIAFDPLLSKVKIVADSWDPHEMEMKEIVFPHWKRWAEMNAKFCSEMRNFFRGKGSISSLATRLCGSGDLFLGGRSPAFSFNFVTRNVGPTLVDLVSYSSIESSWNCGEEGPTNKILVLETRLKQIRNFIFVLFVSLGVPVLNMGDECGQSTRGSLEYSDRISFDWSALKSGFGTQVTEFISFLSSLRIRRNDLLQKRSFLKEDNIEWHGAEGGPPMWDDPSCKFLAMTLKADPPLSDLFVAFNGGDCSEKVALPPLAAVDANWVCLVDTSLPFPGFFTEEGVPLEDGLETYEMKSHSCVLFEARSFI